MNVTTKFTNESNKYHPEPGLQNEWPYVILTKIENSCYGTNLSHSDYNYVEDETSETLYCPRTFDDVTCWDATPAGVTAFQNCPSVIPGFNSSRLAYKTCTLNGTWFSKEDESRPWTNYTTCITEEDLSYRYMINNLYTVGYVVSIIFLLISLSIYAYFKTLRSVRHRIHMNVFVAYLLDNITWIVWYTTVTNDIETQIENTVYCQGLHVVSIYPMITLHIWLFTEGVFLHLSVVSIFVNEELLIKWFYVIGWGSPAAIVLSYSGVRYYNGNTAMCWIINYRFNVLVIMNVILPLIGSLYLLVHVARAVYLSIYPNPNQSILVTTKKATKAVVILVVLYISYIILIPFRPSPEYPADKAYEIIFSTMASLQGVCASFIFCLTNPDVKALIRLHYARYRSAETGIPLTGYIICDRLVNTRRRPAEHQV